MYSRIGRISVDRNAFTKRSDSGVIDYFDTLLKASYRLYDKELDLLALELSDEDIELFIKEYKTYPEKVRTILILNSTLNRSI